LEKELLSQEQLLKSQIEVQTLEKTLELKSSQQKLFLERFDEQKLKNEFLQQQLEERDLNRIQLTSDMSRQYKTMQAKMSQKIQNLEFEVIELKNKLERTQLQLQETIKENEKTISEKDLIIEDQHVKMSYMSHEFEQMLNDTLIKMTKKVELVSLKWKETEGIKLSESSQKRLIDFQVNRCLS
ncbi:hypothetical protein HK099_007416, partial [Clydaea vesicula]